MSQYCISCQAIIEDDDFCCQVMHEAVFRFLHRRCEEAYYGDNAVICSGCNNRILSDGVWIHNSPLHRECEDESFPSIEADTLHDTILEAITSEPDQTPFENNLSEIASLGSLPSKSENSLDFSPENEVEDRVSSKSSRSLGRHSASSSDHRESADVLSRISSASPLTLSSHEQALEFEVITSSNSSSHHSASASEERELEFEVITSSNSSSHHSASASEERELEFEVITSSNNSSHYSASASEERELASSTNLSSDDSESEVEITECNYCGDLLDEDYRVYSTGEENIVLHARCLEEYKQHNGPFCTHCTELLEGDCISLVETFDGETTDLYLHKDCLKPYRRANRPICAHCDDPILEKGFLLTHGTQEHKLHANCLEVFQHDRNLY